MTISIQCVEDREKAKLRRLLADHLAEMNVFADVGTDYRFFDSYWTDAQARWPYWICSDDKTIGFALVNTWSPSGLGTDHSMAEFYIAHEARQRGFGAQALRVLAARHPGQWELGVLERNVAALAFWPKAIERACGQDMSTTYRCGQIIFRFAVSV